MLRRQKVWLAIVVVTNLALWIIPSDVVEQIARDRHTMLGRYSRPHFTAIVIVGLVSIASLYVDWAKSGAAYKRRWFQLIATLLALFPSLAVVDFFLRKEEDTHYTHEVLAYHRPPNREFNATFTDQPQAYRSYPNAPAGHGTIDGTLRADRRGFRNQTDLERYDVVAIGDSFTEGSNVSDGDPWPARLAALSGATVYNMGMSGYEPLHYLESLKAHALALMPRIVICMIYEGNDFRSAKADEKLLRPDISRKIHRYVKQSPLINAFDNFLIQTFGPIRANAPVPGGDILDWMPLSVPSGPKARHYAFEPKQLRDLMATKEEFAAGKHWLHSRHQLLEMHELCRANGSRLVLTYAPTAAHVLMPLVADRVDPEKVRAFAAISYKGELPPADEFMTALLERVEAKQAVVSEWCKRESIPFIDLTLALRAAALEGRQVYYTYDQHWTPIGHEVVAEKIAAFLREQPPTGDTTVSSN